MSSFDEREAMVACLGVKFIGRVSSQDRAEPRGASTVWKTVSARRRTRMAKHALSCQFRGEQS